MLEAIIPKIAKPKKPRIYLRQVDGAFVPADRFAADELRKKRIKDGDIVGAWLSRLRSKGLNRLIHKIGLLCTFHIEDFRYLDGHEALKRLQLEADIACVNVKVRALDWSWVTCRLPLSLSFDSMDECEFREVSVRLCDYISERYWPELEPEQIESMAKLMPEHV